MSVPEPNPADFTLFCDEPADKQLFHALQGINDLLQRIPNSNVMVYPSAQSAGAVSAVLERIKPLHQDDRPDWVFCYRGQPVLVVELTQHAYTGDNGLQRFARFAAAAENRVSFLYFGPRARVRDDELDGPSAANPRRLTSDVFIGMQRLSEIFGVLQGFVEWKTDKAGLPKRVPYKAIGAEISEVYGELSTAIATCLFEAPLPPQGSPLRHPRLDAMQRETQKLARTVNTKTSEVRLDVPPAELVSLVLDPRKLQARMRGYFQKGKPDKTLAEYALLAAHIEYVQWPDGSIQSVSPSQLKELLQQFLAIPRFSKASLVYYTGYKWRSDPHAGVLVNLDYRLCRNQRAEREKGLVVFYPRISLVNSSGVASKLDHCSDDPDLTRLFVARYGAAGGPRMAAAVAANAPFASWSNKTKQARLFRKYADLIVLNDGLVIGDDLAGLVHKV